MEHFLGASFFNHLTQIHEDDVVGDTESLAKGVSYHHDAVILLQFGEELLHLLAADRVECGSTLICKQIARFNGKAACQAEALLLTAALQGAVGLQLPLVVLEFWFVLCWCAETGIVKSRLCG